jgi:glutaredoxin
MKKYLSLIALSLVLSACSISAMTPEDQLARCLKDKGVKMYGSSWCPYCVKYKNIFGDAWSSVPFVDCSTDKAICERAGVDEYPTWYFPDTRAKKKGFIRLDILAHFGSCPYTADLPKESGEEASGE